jgi:hypothetical protein
MIDQAARVRACREQFEFAMANGLSMPEARAELARRRWAALDARLAAARCGTRAPGTVPLPDNQPWMMRD